MTSPSWLALPLCLMSWGCSSQCVLDDDLRQFAGEQARDCGATGSVETRAPVDECVAEAFEASEPFIARYERMAVDSKVVTAVAGNTAGDVKLFQWDSAPCGGSGCDPVTDVQSCHEPSLNAETSDDPDALPIACESMGLPERTCG